LNQVQSFVTKQHYHLIILVVENMDTLADTDPREKLSYAEDPTANSIRRALS
jgi:hypothetical protein